jgi:hypothetical protein
VNHQEIEKSLTFCRSGGKARLFAIASAMSMLAGDHELDDDHDRENQSHEQSHAPETVHQIHQVIARLFVYVFPRVVSVHVCIHEYNASSGWFHFM